MAVRVVFPGSFDPLTVAHVGIARAARSQLDAEVVHLVMSTVALGKEQGAATPIATRLAQIRAVGDVHPWIRAGQTEASLLADIAAGYDALVIGADKWHQLHDIRFYGNSPEARDAALAGLPTLAVAPRHGAELPADADVVHLDLPEELRRVSSTAVRAGRREWQA